MDEAEKGFNIIQMKLEWHLKIQKFMLKNLLKMDGILRFRFCRQIWKSSSFRERECSIQRSNQKLIEESPSLFVDDDLRNDLTSKSLQLSKKVNYVGAGTIEFLVDDKKNFYFIEMNTRIQVEHTVTEMVYMIDLVKEQIRTYAGIELSIKQEDICMNGHAIE